MPLAAGTRVGPYEITAPLGKGGMGEVYRATDLKLKRDVALKVLPTLLSDDPTRMARFQREAEVLASLNHSNIAQIYGLEEQNGLRAIVMELVEGETLADIIKRGPIPVETAIAYSKQIASALEYAHDKQRPIIHRDLKPANIQVTPEGVVKVLDFGLAKALADEPVASSADPGNSPTLTMGHTVVGMILGTAAYMSPEQAKGKTLDRRSDIWSFGVVLYEMVTGQRLFTGEEVGDILAAIVLQEPKLDAVPARLRPAIERCLRKDPRKRWYSMEDVRFALDEPAPLETAPASQARRPSWTPWTIAAAAVVAALGLALLHFREAAPEPSPAVRFSVPYPPSTNSASATADALAGFALSPDGRMLAFSAVGQGAKSSLWLQRLDSHSAQNIERTAGASTPFWSPDSRELAFFADGMLKRISLTADTPVTVCPAPNQSGGSWNLAGQILFSSNGTLHLVSASGGTPSAVTTLDDAAKDISHAFPIFLPDGRQFLYAVRGPQGGTYVQKLGSKDRKLVTTDSLGGFAPPNRLLLGRNGTAMVQDLDLTSFKPVGDPQALEPDINGNSIYQRSAISVSGNGVVAFRPTQAASRMLGVYQRNGRRDELPVSAPNTSQLVLSPDGRWLAVQRGQIPRADLWLLEIASGVFSRLTSDPDAEVDPVWSPDSRRVLFASRSQAKNELREVTVGTSDEKVIYSDPDAWALDDWSRDGKWIVFRPLKETSVRLLTYGEHKAQTVGSGTARIDETHVSPDGRWVTFNSIESGDYEVYVAAFPSFQQKRQISVGGGSQPQWRGDGKELYYLAPDRRLWAVDIKSGSILETGAPRPLFQTKIAYAPVVHQYAPSPDGQKFYVAEPSGEDRPELRVIVNWPALLKK
ncbi:MAG: protein kinase [Acidobacteriota bacterium]